MELQLFIVSVFCLVLTNQQEGGKELLTTEGFSFDEAYFSSLHNSTFPAYEDDSVPCDINVPGFHNLGLMITFILVFVFSMVGNSVVVYVVCYMKKGRASTDIYLMHLAMADLLFSITLPFWAVDTHSGWIFGNFLCKVLSGFQEASVYSGVFLLACISVDRHFAIVRATRVLSSNRFLVRVVCSVVWLVAGLLSLPVAIQKQTMHADSLDQTICYENLTGESSNHWRVSIRVLRHTMGFFLPLVVMAVCYGWTLVTLVHTRNQQKQKAIRVIMAVVLAFVLCWLPYNITVLIDTLIRGGSLEMRTCETLYRVEVTLRVTQVLAFMHCAVNPVLYAFIGQKFRNQLLLALYKHGLISNRIRMAYRKGSLNSVGSSKSRNTSATM
ncbi:C-X-C chemokine receptor type 1 [Chaetodon trifascialis]|uniref:C-X-C chemokine receptor type 1 n=1 Tax=Chaetodon trifascialis TaxID=109706 RepID=UPI0039941A70